MSNKKPDQVEKENQEKLSLNALRYSDTARVLAWVSAVSTALTLFAAVWERFDKSFVAVGKAVFAVVVIAILIMVLLEAAKTESRAKRFAANLFVYSISIALFSFVVLLVLATWDELAPDWVPETVEELAQRVGSGLDEALKVEVGSVPREESRAQRKDAGRAASVDASVMDQVNWHEDASIPQKQTERDAGSAKISVPEVEKRKSTQPRCDAKLNEGRKLVRQIQSALLGSPALMRCFEPNVVEDLRLARRKVEDALAESDCSLLGGRIEGLRDTLNSSLPRILGEECSPYCVEKVEDRLKLELCDHCGVKRYGCWSPGRADCLGAAEDGTCNGWDDDCDGEKDEDFQEQKCKGDLFDEGLCKGISRTCENGEVLDCSVSRVSKFERKESSCDGFDNDCDGVIDGGLTGRCVENRDEDIAWAGCENDVCRQNCDGLFEIRMTCPVFVPDCDDSDKELFHRNPKVSTEPSRISGSFDYDCDGKVELFGIKRGSKSSKRSSPKVLHLSNMKIRNSCSGTKGTQRAILVEFDLTNVGNEHSKLCGVVGRRVQCVDGDEDIGYQAPEITIACG